MGFFTFFLRLAAEVVLSCPFCICVLQVRVDMFGLCQALVSLGCLWPYDSARIFEVSGRCFFLSGHFQTLAAISLELSPDDLATCRSWSGHVLHLSASVRCDENLLHRQGS